jgi:hypothetical protein
MASDMAPLSGSNGKLTTMLPGTTGKAFNTSNHDDLGQNVAFGDAHVDFLRNPYTGYTGTDNIFTLGAGTTQIPVGMSGIGPNPPLFGDAVMVPVRDASTGQLGP